MLCNYLFRVGRGFTIVAAQTDRASQSRARTTHAHVSVLQRRCVIHIYGPGHQAPLQNISSHFKAQKH